MSTQGTAVITGASSGIGAEFARQLAARGYDLLLIGRRRVNLERLASDIAARHTSQVEILQADLADRDQVGRVAARLAQLGEPTMLVNSAGFGTTGRFARVEVRKHIEMIELHLAASVVLTHAILPKMVERKRGALVYVASTAAFMPLPGNVTYCATKSFLVAFTEGLEPEVKLAGVHVQVLCPGFTHTEFHDTPEYVRFNPGSLPEIMWLSAEEVVAASLRGLDRGQRVVIPGTVNRMIVGTGRLPLVGRGLRAILIRRLMFSRKPEARGAR